MSIRHEYSQLVHSISHHEHQIILHGEFHRHLLAARDLDVKSVGQLESPPRRNDQPWREGDEETLVRVEFDGLPVEDAVGDRPHCRTTPLLLVGMEMLQVHAPRDDRGDVHVVPTGGVSGVQEGRGEGRAHLGGQALGEFPGDAIDRGSERREAVTEEPAGSRLRGGECRDEILQGLDGPRPGPVARGREGATYRPVPVVLGGDDVAVVDARDAVVQVGHERPLDLIEVGDAGDGDNAVSRQSPEEEAGGFCAIERLVGDTVRTDGWICR